MESLGLPQAVLLTPGMLQPHCVCSSALGEHLPLSLTLALESLVFLKPWCKFNHDDIFLSWIVIFKVPLSCSLAQTSLSLGENLADGADVPTIPLSYLGYWQSSFPLHLTHWMHDSAADCLLSCSLVVSYTYIWKSVVFKSRGHVIAHCSSQAFQPDTL